MIAWMTLTAFALVSIFIVFPLYYTVRSYKASVYSQGERISKTYESATRQRADVFAVEALKTTARRLAIVNSTAVVIRDCGGRVEYQMGNTLWIGVVSMFVPRILWPDKPIVVIGFQFAKTFHVVSFGNYAYISPGQPGELYWNFHVPGVVLGMFFIGFWFRALYQRFGLNRGTDPFRLGIYVTLLYASLVGTDGGIGAVEGQVIRELLIFLALEKAFLIFQPYGRRQSGVVPGIDPVPAQ